VSTNSFVENQLRTFEGGQIHPSLKSEGKCTLIQGNNQMVFEKSIEIIF